MGYLDWLDELLRAGRQCLGPGLREVHLDWLLTRQLPAGGFPGRQGPADLYYTDFALRLLWLLEAPADPGARAAAWLAQSPPPRDVVEAFSLLNCARLLARAGLTLDLDRAALAEVVHRQTLPGGGCARPGGGEVSAYHTFLGALCLDLLGEALPHPEAAAAAIRGLRCPAGGYAERPGAALAQTSATAAALGFLGRSNVALAGAEADARFLVAQQAPDGGLRAHPQAAAGDLLSSFTGLLSLVSLGGARALDLAALARFVRRLASPAGGFLACSGDAQADVEYGYYGLGTLALLAWEAGTGDASR